AGTGEANMGPSKSAISRDNIYYGRGVLKSSNAGATWTLLTGNAGQNEFDRRTISRIVIDPTDSNIVYVAVGALATNGLAGNTGTRAGNFPTGADANIGRITVAIAPGNDSIIYASIAHSGSNASLYTMMTSTDGGTTWTQLGNTPNFMGSFGDYNTALAVDP